jgi:hypothetical protein
MYHDHYVLPCLHTPRAQSIRGALLGENVAREAAKRVRALADPTRLMLLLVVLGEKMEAEA